MTNQAPKRIYLQQYFDYSDDMVTWCQDKINDEDIEYILQSEYDKLHTESERLRAVMTKIVALTENYMKVSVDFLLQDAVDLAEQALKSGE